MTGLEAALPTARPGVSYHYTRKRNALVLEVWRADPVLGVLAGLRLLVLLARVPDDQAVVDGVESV
jgi:hypothetical protein